MIHVIATIELKPECRQAFLEIFNRNIPNVKAETGCLAYEPTVDVQSDIPAQGDVRDNVVTIIEAWENLDCLHKHLQAPHMATYREAVKDLVNQVNLQILKPA